MVEGEIIYRGANVAMGYAEEHRDLADGDVWEGRLATGDIGRLSPGKLLQITGRKKRFLKLNGVRLNLEQIENEVTKMFSGSEVACVGNDKRLTLFVCGIDEADLGEVKRKVCRCIFTFNHTGGRSISYCITKKFERQNRP